MSVNAKATAGTSRDKTGTNRDRQGQAETFSVCSCLSLLVPVCPCLSMLVPAYPCLSPSVPVDPCPSLSVPFCPCLSLYVSSFASCLPLQMNITIFISMNTVTLTFLAKATVLVNANLVFNFFFNIYFASSKTLLFNPNSSILVINITKGSTWFLLNFFSSV